MTASMIIEPGIGEWRSALIGDDGFPTQLNFHPDASLSPVDGIFAARVTTVDSTLDMAFLDLGGGVSGAMNLRRAKLLTKNRAESIGDCLREGQLLTVQVVAEPSALDDKAVPVTPRPRLLGRYVVAEHGGARLNFSKDLSANAQKKLAPLLTEASSQAAVIVRSTAQGVDPDIVAREAALLADAVTRESEAPGLLFGHSPLMQALLAAPEDDTPIMVEGGSALAEAKAAAQRHWPDMLPRLMKYDGKAAFEDLGVEEAIEEALADRIELPSGGWISVTPTPAFTAIDVNMGGALKGRNAGEAKIITNLEAAMAIAYHLRFQDIGGLIVVDFIDMSAKGAARELMQTLEAAFREDIAPVQHTGISQFGLVEINRRRKGLSLRDRMLRHRAPADRPAAQAQTLLRQAARTADRPDPGDLVLTAPKSVLSWLEARPALLEALRKASGRTLAFAEDGSTLGAHLRAR